MKKSESITKIAAALMKFNREVGTVKRDGTNQITSGGVTSKYATLDNIIETIRPAMAEHGLMIIQEPGVEEGVVTMKTTILHESGEWIKSDTLRMKPQKTDPQGIGSTITYARRYQLGALLNLATEEDDDGNHASNRNGGNKSNQGNRQPQTRGQGGWRQQNQTGNVVQMKNPNDPLTEPQRRKIFGVLNGKGFTEEQIKRLVQKHAEKGGVSELTKQEANHFIDLVQPMQPEELLETIGEGIAR